MTALRAMNRSGQRRAIPSAGFLLLGLATLLVHGAIGQGYDARWIGGYAGSSGNPDFGGNKTLFLAGNSTYSVPEPHNWHLRAGMAVITDEQDSILAYTDGWRLINAAHQLMLNGDGLNPSSILNSSTGLSWTFCNLFLPWPGHPDSIVLVHNVPDAVWPGTNAFHAAQLYYSVVVRGLDGGTLTGVSSKNNVLLQEPLIAGGLGAVKHANGRDWWVLSHRMESNEFVFFLLTPQGFQGPWYQAIGSHINGSGPGATFSMQGDRLAYGQYASGLDILDFDRCTGLLSNARNTTFSDGAFFRMAQFAPDGAKLYVPGGIYLYQLLLEANGDVASLDTVAFYDGFYDDNTVFATYFAYPMLARDGRIYISTGNSTRYMHVVNDPEATGTACDVQQHGHHRITWTTNSIPYRPNYLLGPVPGSDCDSLDLSTGGLEPYPVGAARVQPNPSQGSFSITYSGQPAGGVITVLDAAGRIVYRQRLSAWSTLHRVELPPVAPGLYHCHLTCGNKAATVRVGITE